MSNVLFLVHRLPFPPNKGDKVRSYHLLKHIAAQHRVFLGTFVDDPEDWRHVEMVRGMCADLHVSRIFPRWAKVRSLRGLLTHEALSVDYYRDSHLHAWVKKTVAEQKIDAIIIFSSVMAQYVDDLPGIANCPLLVDFVDVDSAKWTQYASNHRWPLSWLYQREGERLLAYERKVASRSTQSFFVTEIEAALFSELAPENAPRVAALSNGVDTDFYSPLISRPTPFAIPHTGPDNVAIVFTGAMDYWPNIDAVNWFSRDVLPQLRREWPHLVLYIVGRNPPAVVQSLASASIVVTGTVPDVRPYLQYADVVIAPLRVARGIQNKILEAMAMERPVVASVACAKAMGVRLGEEILSASDALGYTREISALLRAPLRANQIGQRARQKVVQDFSWDFHLAGIDKFLGDPPIAYGAA